MELAVSNIAWQPPEEAAVADWMAEVGLRWVEIAPTRTWSDPARATPSQARMLRRFWSERGIEIVSLQALLFGRPELTLFESSDQRRRMARHLEILFSLAAELGAEVLVFSAPTQRRLGIVSPEEAWTMAVDFFRHLGESARASGVRLCIEPTAAASGCDFVTRAAEGRRLVGEVGSEGFGMLLDLAAMRLEGEDIPREIESSASLLHHFHISAPRLADVSREPPSDLATALAALDRARYHGCVSVEMRAGEAGSNLERVRIAVDHVRSLAPAGALTLEPRRLPH